MMMYDRYYWILLLVLALSLFAQGAVMRTFRRYSGQSAARGMSAEQVVSALLLRAGSAVTVRPVSGSLTDHYDPKSGQVGLSEAVYGSRSVAAIAVAAHEVGHVLQYESGYLPIRFRNAVLPAARIGSTAAPYLVIAGLLLGSLNLAAIGVLLFGAMLLFQLVTLPVEFNASARALRLLEENGYLLREELPAAKKVLRAAAMTYVCAALAALVNFLRLAAMVLRASGRRRR